MNVTTVYELLGILGCLFGGFGWVISQLREIKRELHQELNALRDEIKKELDQIRGSLDNKVSNTLCEERRKNCPCAHALKCQGDK